MQNRLRPVFGEDFVQPRPVANIALFERPPADEFLMPVGEIVKNDRFIPSFREEKARVRTDIAGTTDDKDFLLHQLPFKKLRMRRDCMLLCLNKGGVAQCAINQSILRG